MRSEGHISARPLRSGQANALTLGLVSELGSVPNRQSPNAIPPRCYRSLGNLFGLDDVAQVVFTQADSSRLARFGKVDTVTARCESTSKLFYAVMTGCLL